jgi:hypothetical protein
MVKHKKLKYMTDDQIVILNESGNDQKINTIQYGKIESIESIPNHTV